MREVSTEIEINASPQQVWDVFSNLSRFSDWNPFITKAEGELEVGNELRMTLYPPGGRAMEFHPKVLVAVPGKEVSWQGHIPGVFTGEHHFTIEAIGDDKTRFKQHSRFTGLATRFIGNNFVEGGRQGFEAMERSLKDRVEKLPR